MHVSKQLFVYSIHVKQCQVNNIKGEAMVKKSQFYIGLFNRTNNLTLLYRVSAILSGKKVYVPKYIPQSHLLGQFGNDFIDYIQEISLGKTLYIPKLYNSRDIADFKISKTKIVFYTFALKIKNILNKQKLYNM